MHRYLHGPVSVWGFPAARAALSPSPPLFLSLSPRVRRFVVPGGPSLPLPIPSPSPSLPARVACPLHPGIPPSASASVSCSPLTLSLPRPPPPGGRTSPRRGSPHQCDGTTRLGPVGGPPDKGDRVPPPSALRRLAIPGMQNCTSDRFPSTFDASRLHIGATSTAGTYSRSSTNHGCAARGR